MLGSRVRSHVGACTKWRIDDDDGDDDDDDDGDGGGGVKKLGRFFSVCLRFMVLLSGPWDTAAAAFLLKMGWKFRFNIKFHSIEQLVLDTCDSLRRLF